MKDKELREILEKLICRENGMPYGTPMDDTETININEAITDIENWARGKNED